MVTVTTSNVKVRLPKQKDIPAIVRFDTEHGEALWTHDELVRVLTQEQEVWPLIAMQRNEIVGLLMYEVHKHKFDVISLVCKNGDLDDIGSALMREMMHNFIMMAKRRIVMAVRESDLKSQLFLRDLDFKCTKIVKDWYRDHLPGKDPQFEDAYRFQYESKK